MICPVTIGYNSESLKSILFIIRGPGLIAISVLRGMSRRVVMACESGSLFTTVGTTTADAVDIVYTRDYRLIAIP